MAIKVIDRKATGARIKELIDKSNIDLKEAAEQINVSRQAIYKAVSGDGLLKLEHLLLLSRLLDCKIDDILIPDEKVMKEFKKEAKKLIKKRQR